MIKVTFFISDGEIKVSENLINALIRLFQHDLEVEGFKVTHNKSEETNDASSL